MRAIKPNKHINNLRILLKNLRSNFNVCLVVRIIKSKMALIQALIAVAKAMPISLIVVINMRDKIIFIMTLTMEIYKGVLVSSLAKKHTIKTLINT